MVESTHGVHSLGSRIRSCSHSPWFPPAFGAKSNQLFKEFGRCAAPAWPTVFPQAAKAALVGRSTVRRCHRSGSQPDQFQFGLYPVPYGSFGYGGPLRGSVSTPD
jgi:hypothetical protein